MRLRLPVKDHELHSQKPWKIYWRLLWEIYLFGSKKDINYQIKFTKCLLGEMPIRGKVIRGIVRRGNELSGNCPFEKLSPGELSVGEISSGKSPLEKSPSGKCPSENCPDTFYAKAIIFFKKNCFIFFFITCLTCHKGKGSSQDHHKHLESSATIVNAF